MFREVVGLPQRVKQHRNVFLPDSARDSIERN